MTFYELQSVFSKIGWRISFEEGIECGLHYDEAQIEISSSKHPMIIDAGRLSRNSVIKQDEDFHSMVLKHAICDLTGKPRYNQTIWQPPTWRKGYSVFWSGMIAAPEWYYDYNARKCLVSSVEEFAVKLSLHMQ